nr:serine/arginine repetitive matrix protein 2-like [Dermacentor andersoni]
MDPQGLGDPPTRRRPPDADGRGQPGGEAPAASSAPVSRAKSSPVQLQKKSAGKDQKAASPRPASSTPADSTPLRTTASPNASSVSPVHQLKRQRERASQVVEKASPSEHKSPECFALDPSFCWVRLEDSKDSSCVDALMVSGSGDEATSKTRLLDDSFSASAKPAEPPGKRPRAEPALKGSSALPSTTREGKPGEPRATSSSDGGDQLGASCTLKSDDERPKTYLLHNVSSRVGTLLGKIFGRSPSGRVAQPEAVGPEVGARTGGASRKRKPHSYASRQTGDTEVVTKVRPRTKESLLQPVAHSYTKTMSTQDVAAESVGACVERLSKSQEGVTEGVAAHEEKRDREAMLEIPATESSLTGVPFPDGDGDVQVKRRRRTRLPTGRVRGSAAASTHRYTVAVMTAAGESPKRGGHGEKKSKAKKHRKDRQPDDGDAKARKSRSSSSGRGKKHGRKQGRRRDKESSARSSRERRKRKRDDKTEDATDILEMPTQTGKGSTYDVSDKLASREFSFEIAMQPFTRGALPRPELTRPSKQRLGSMRESPVSPMSPQSVEPGSPVSPERKASSPHEDDLRPLIKHEAREDHKARSRRGHGKKPSAKDDLSPPVETSAPPSPADKTKKPRKTRSDRKSRSERRHRSKSKHGSKRAHSGKGKRSRGGEPHEKEESSPPKEATASSPAPEPNSREETSHRKSRSKRSHKSKSKSKHGSKHGRRRKGTSHSSRESGERSSREHRKRHGTHGRKKKYSPKGAPGRSGTGPYVFEWGTADIPGVAGVELKWSTTHIHLDSGGLPSPGGDYEADKHAADWLPFTPARKPSQATGTDKKRSEVVSSTTPSPTVTSSDLSSPGKHGDRREGSRRSPRRKREQRRPPQEGKKQGSKEPPEASATPRETRRS